MFLYYYVVNATGNYIFDALLVDPLVSDINNVSVQCECEYNTNVRDVLQKITPYCSNEYYERVMPKVEFYIRKVYKYFDQNMHGFILYYTCILCSLLGHGSKSNRNEGEGITCNIEFLFNILAACKLYELCKSNLIFYDFLAAMEEGLINVEINKITSGIFRTEYTVEEQKDLFRIIFNESIKFKSMNRVLYESKLDRFVLANSRDDSINKKILDHVSKSSFERLFSLIITLKYHLLFKNNTYTLEQPFFVYNFTLDDDLYQNLVKTSLWFPQELITQFDLQCQEILYNHIFDRTFKRLSSDVNIFEKVFRFAKERPDCYFNQPDLFFPEYILVLFVANDQFNKIISVYKFLAEIIDIKYHEYIKILVCIKSSCLIPKNISFEAYLRIIFEIIFLVDIVSQVYVENNIESKVLHQVQTINNNIRKTLENFQIRYNLDRNDSILVGKRITKAFIDIKLMLVTIFFLDYSSKRFLELKIRKFLDEKNIIRFNDSSDAMNDYIIYLVFKELDLTRHITVNASSSNKKFNLPDLICVLIILTVIGTVCGVIFYILRK
ncbi:hypothetical protein CWI38_0312p0030 [Hamiltosporidium tvaerminnensis]|uniref:Uncharacterized protein n=1 Tax=Hamiltosporidium tvaerminnensis TaxID=1176355 RepID=A0A4Q9M1C7_9MICR|nr:hypothetical protein CWI38_0312p0030 [Hamiltosporidium tvaerminnensis]